jgi:hypothetical protein
VNCLLQRLTLRKDCSQCPITSTIGLVSNNSGISFAHHHDALIVWDASKANISNKCIVTEVKKGAGIVNRKNEKTFQLIDNAGQLEYSYQEKTDTICGMELHKLTNLDTAYLRITPLISSAIYTVVTRLCLDIDLFPVACNAQKSMHINNRRPNKFVFVDSQIAILTGNKTECMVHQSQPNHQFSLRRVKCDSRLNFRWDSASLRISGISVSKSGTDASLRIGCLAPRFNTNESIFLRNVTNLSYKNGYLVHRAHQC